MIPEQYRTICPCCHKPWPKDYKCLPCKMFRSITPNKFWIFKQITNGQYQEVYINWSEKESYIEFYDGKDIVEITIEDIPFDVTEDQVKLYLTFS